MSTIEQTIVAFLSEAINQAIEQGFSLQRPDEDNPKQPNLPPTLDVLDVARHLKVSKYTVINRIKQGKLKAYKQGRHWKIKREWLLEYEEGLIENKK
ncbi:helix-turn-helix domain-containing protein [Paenibacillus farraposensis]|uniref:Helix-turn-helix domain-containing protein n=1 Tax=Paenibacillus farraposensis TaxID=2807095 RepID=A0ABW4DD54_9BACL|nr:helix-turn-helix domain-containing protein [Paenibacillus farraposensis]MCC3380738.1 helix-turn-helix domain-containing protein [Paenibacillus farraposensis]